MESIPVYWVIPFALLLLSIAIIPLVAPLFWESNRNKGIVAIGLAIPTAIYLILHHPHSLLHSGHEYFSFISLLAALFIISGGILLTGDLEATPRINTTFLAIGAVLANIIGTTGASMLLIRPLLKTNQERRHVKHIPIFFIFVVSNIGGLLTPIGDPPLFLGYLRGVPFFWTLCLIPIWLLMNGLLLTIFYFVDRWVYRKETPKDILRDKGHIEPLRLQGSLNFLLLAGVVCSVFLPTPYREVIMLSLAVLSYKMTPRQIHKKNSFTFHAIIEVAVLFAGIFTVMVPALELIRHHGPEFGITAPYQFFWLTGSLSGFLDNAPTYLTFLSMAQGLQVAGAQVVGVTNILLMAVSAGAVLMGALTYIGNGPNFMVKAIADEAGFRTPSFFGYMLYSVFILCPLFVLVTVIFFRGG